MPWLLWRSFVLAVSPGRKTACAIADRRAPLPAPASTSKKRSSELPCLLDVFQPLPFSTGFFCWHQTEISGDLFATVEALRLPDDQHEPQGGKCTHSLPDGSSIAAPPGICRPPARSLLSAQRSPDWSDLGVPTSLADDGCSIRTNDKYSNCRRPVSRHSLFL